MRYSERKAMFTWICPKCGAEVLPSYSECPNCARPPEEQPAAEPAAAPRAAAAAPAAPARPAGPRVPLPGWAVAVLVAVVLVGLGAGAYFFLLPSSKAKSQTAAVPPAPFESPASQPAPSARPHPLAKFIEIAGLRVTEDARQKAQIKFLVINHSGAELGDVTLAITLKPSVAKPGDKPLASYSVKVARLGPYESRELETSVKTELRAYELPDWQFLRAEFEITSPPAP
jgi:hypothetical protein